MFRRAETNPAELLTLASRLVPDPCVVSTTHGDETILLNAATGRYFTLNSVGGEVWTAVCDEEPLSTVVTRLGEKYHSAVDRIEADVLALAQRLVSASLVHAN